MKKLFLLFSFIFTAGLCGCVAGTVIVEDSGAYAGPEPIVTWEDPSDYAAPAAVRPQRAKRERATIPLIYAVSIDNFDGVRYLLGQGANPNEIFYSSSYEATPLLEAVKLGRFAIAQYLIERGADVNLKADDKTPLEAAVRQNNLEMTALLVSRKANLYPDGILEDAVREHDSAALRYLLNGGAAKRSVTSARKNADAALIKACKIGNIEAMRLLIKAGADPRASDAKNRGLFFYAAQKNDSAVLELVYHYDKKTLDSEDSDGVTPLMAAAESGNFSGVKFLVSKGAHTGVSEKTGRNAAHYSKNDEITKYLNEAKPQPRKPAAAARKEAPNPAKQEAVIEKPLRKSETKPKPEKSKTNPARIMPEKQPRASKSVRQDRRQSSFEVDAAPKREKKRETKPERITPKEKNEDKKEKPQSAQNVQTVPSAEAVKPETETAQSGESQKKSGRVPKRSNAQRNR
jgi:ankyrin repeat protein